MKLSQVKKGQRFVLSRNGQEFEHHGMHPGSGRHVLVAPFSNDPLKVRMLHIMREVEVLS